METMTDRQKLAAELADSLDCAWGGGRAEIDLADGRRIVVTLAPDEDTSVNDYDCYGKVSPGFSFTDRGMRLHRPDGFDGASRKIQVDQSMSVWWQPFDGFAKLDRDAQRAELERVTDLLRAGFWGLVVKVETRCDQGFWHPRVEDSLWGLDSTDPDNLAFVLDDLLCELGVDGDLTRAE